MKIILLLLCSMLLGCNTIDSSNTEEVIIEQEPILVDADKTGEELIDNTINLLRENSYELHALATYENHEDFNQIVKYDDGLIYIETTGVPILSKCFYLDCINIRMFLKNVDEDDWREGSLEIEPDSSVEPSEIYNTGITIFKKIKDITDVKMDDNEYYIYASTDDYGIAGVTWDERELIVHIDKESGYPTLIEYAMHPDDKAITSTTTISNFGSTIVELPDELNTFYEENN